MVSHSQRDLSSARETIYQAISAIRLIDPHTHINPHAPASTTLADILGYHYYTELVHSAGMPRLEIEEPNIGPQELVRRLVFGLENISNTANYGWLIDLCQSFFGFEDDQITSSNWEALYDAAETEMSSPNWSQQILDQSNVEAVFLTNDFDDALAGFDTKTYIPCLRTDDLVFHLAKPEVRQRLESCSGISLDGSLSSLRDALRQRFEHFVAHGARACAISLPPTFAPTHVSDAEAAAALDQVLKHGLSSNASSVETLSNFVFWTLAQLCSQFRLPFDLMIGVNRGVYPAGVFQGQDLYDSRVSLIQYRELFNAFPTVKFPISVLASVTNQELVSYSWIFPNVITNGHWWYSNTPSFIHRDLSARLEAVPRSKQIGYYSDAYKLEFVLPKFDMYRRILSNVLAEQFVGENGWSEERAIELGHQVLRGNVDRLFQEPQGEPGSWTEAAEVPDVNAYVATASSEQPEELDPVPSDNEIETAGIPDVQLSGRAVDDALAVETDEEPLNVGNIVGEVPAEPSGPDTPGSQIHMLTGDGEFTPDQDSMRLKPDPMTGELQFPIDESKPKKQTD